MNIKENSCDNGVLYYTFPIFEKYGVRHGFSSRIGGVSTGDCAAMNLSFHRGDDENAVMENHRRLAEAIGYEVEDLVLSDQVHGTKICRVSGRDRGKGVLRESDLIGVDGLMTDEKNVVLMTFFADCVPLFFYDTKSRAVAASHSGWRGTVKRIGAKTVERMKEEYGTSSENIIAVIGPSICRDCYEVSADVALEFQKEFKKEEWEQILFQKPGQKEQEKYQLDLWRANEIILCEAGIPQNQIQTSGFCTCCHPQILFSHRASGGRRGNLAGVIMPGGGAA